MDRTKASQDIVDLFILAVNKYNAIEKVPMKVGTKLDLYHSEKHFLDKIGDHPGVNVTEFAGIAGITKGAVSQFVGKLESKGLLRKYKGRGNDKEVLLELTKAGRDVYLKHKKKNEETTRLLMEEMKKYPDDKIAFLISIFEWIVDYLDQSKEHMQQHR